MNGSMPKFPPGYHLGNFLLDGLKKRPEDQICRLDAATRQQETIGSTITRSVKMAQCMRKFGLKPTDVIAIGGRNHLDLQIPYYAAIMNGLPVLGLDPNFKVVEIKTIFNMGRPKLAFCEQKSYSAYVQAFQELGLDGHVVAFGEGENNMANFMEKYQDNEETVEEFKPAEFNPDKVFAWLVSTSGTMGTPKLAAFTHSVLLIRMMGYIHAVKNLKPEPAPALTMSSMQWISAFLYPLVLPMTNFIMIQSSAVLNADHVIDIINEYKPVNTLISPVLLGFLLRSKKECDMTCFDQINITGDKLPIEQLKAIKARTRKDTLILIAYGQTETLGFALLPNPLGPEGSCGKPLPICQYKLMDTKTGNEITEPNVNGELWLKGYYFSEYYNNPEETAASFTKDGWYKTGDLFYRDSELNFYYVERIKMLIKCRRTHIIPTEMEEVIRTHKGVLDVAVTGVPHPEDGMRPVAAVVRMPGADVTAKEIEDIVAESLSDNKHIHGGVIFVSELPTTATGKVARAKVRELVLEKLAEQDEIKQKSSNSQSSSCFLCCF